MSGSSVCRMLYLLQLIPVEIARTWFEAGMYNAQLTQPDICSGGCGRGMSAEKPRADLPGVSLTGMQLSVACICLVTGRPRLSNPFETISG